MEVKVKPLGQPKLAIHARSHITICGQQPEWSENPWVRSWVEGEDLRIAKPLNTTGFEPATSSVPNLVRLRNGINIFAAPHKSKIWLC